MATPTAAERSRVRWKSASVGSTYAELSMSIQTKFPQAAAWSTSRCRFRKQASASRSSPSCVGLMEICASTAAAFTQSSTSR